MAKKSSEKADQGSTQVSEEHETEVIEKEVRLRRRPSAIVLLVVGALIAFGGLLLGGGVGYVVGRAQSRAEARTEAFLRERAYFGVAVIHIDDGALVHELAADSPAEEAGLIVGDIIQRVDGEPVGVDSPLERLILEYAPGDQIEVSVVRGGEREIFDVELGAAPVDFRRGETFRRPEIAPVVPRRSVPVAPSDGFPDRLTPFLGVIVRATDRGGLFIEEVLPASPASRAGLLREDVIVEVDGELVESAEELRDLMEEAGVGGVLELEIRRDGDRMLVQVILGTEFPPSPPIGDPNAAYLGVQVEPFTIDIADELDMPYPGTNGVFVTGVLPESPAQRVGLRERDVILSVDYQNTNDVETFVEAIQSRQPGDVVRLLVFREDQDDFIDFEVALGTNPAVDFFANPEEFLEQLEDLDQPGTLPDGSTPGIELFLFPAGCPPENDANQCL